MVILQGAPYKGGKILFLKTGRNYDPLLGREGQQFLCVNLIDKEDGPSQDDGCRIMADDLYRIVLQDQPLLPVDQKKVIGKLIPEPETEYRVCGKSFHPEKILGENVSVAFLLYKNRDPVVPHNFQDGMKLPFNIRPYMLADGFLVHMVLKLFDRLFSGKHSVKVPVAVGIDQTEHFALHGTQTLIGLGGWIVLNIFPRGIEVPSRLLFKYLSLKHTPPQTVRHITQRKTNLPHC
jgi:hypothetical protein